MKQFISIAQTLPDMAVRSPHQPAVIFPAGINRSGDKRFIQLTYQQLNSLCDRYAHGLSKTGIRKGMRTLVLVQPGRELLGITFALFKIGAVPVVIDPGMGWRSFLQCVRDAQPVGFIGIPSAQFLRSIFRRAFSSVKHAITVGSLGIPGAPTLASLIPQNSSPFPVATVTSESEAAIVFTSGGTGLPKGVLYRQGMFFAQLDLLQNEIGIGSGEIDLPGLYIFALFGPALGLTEVFPDMDPTRPAKVDPGRLVDAIQTHGVSTSFGSPVIWRKVARYCQDTAQQLPTMKRILMAGAPVEPALIEAFSKILTDGDVFTPFGSTEALPLTMISGKEILAETAALSAEGSGMCVGRPVRNVTIRIIPIQDQPIPAWKPSFALPAGEVGEIVVKGPMVTHEYVNRPSATAMAKIREGTDVWHRMGDLGYLDKKGRLWFCGRMSHRVETPHGLMLPVPCEAIFNQHPDVHRTALVGIGSSGKQYPVLVVEPKSGKYPRTRVEQQRFLQQLLELGSRNTKTQSIQHILFYPRPFPVDVRHNAKIYRLELGKWAARKLKGVDF